MKRLRALVASVLVSGMISSLATPAMATTLNFSKPTYIYGAGLSQDEIRRTAEYLGIQSLNNITMDKVTGAELDFYIGNPGSYTSDYEMISSVVVAKAKEGTGLDVNITTPLNITQIKKYQYENACITAGINDVYVNVGAIRPVTGESALAGIYKALEVNNVSLDKNRMEVAQKELEITNKIIQNNTQIIQNNINNTNINNGNQIQGDGNIIVNPGATTPGTTSPIKTKPGNGETTNSTDTITSPITTSPQPTVEINQQIVNELLISIKTEVGEKAKEEAKKEPEKKDIGLTKEEVEAIIDAKLKEKNLENSIDNNVKIELSNVMVDYSKTEAAKSEDVQKQLNELDKKVKEDPNQVKTNSENPIAVTIPEEQKATTTPVVPGTETTVPVVPGTEETTKPEVTSVPEVTTVPTETTKPVDSSNADSKPEVTKDGFVIAKGNAEILPKKVKDVLVGFPEDTNYVLLTLPEADTTKIEFNPQSAANIIKNPYNTPFIPMNNDFIENYNEGFKADYYHENGKDYVYGIEMALSGKLIDLLHVRSDIKTIGEDTGMPLERPTLDTFATAVFSTFLDSQHMDKPGELIRRYIYALSDEINGEMNTVGVFDLGDKTLVLTFKDDKANAYYVLNKSGKKVDYNTMNDEYPQRSMSADGKVMPGMGNEPATTVSPETTAPEETIKPEEVTIPEETTKPVEETTESTSESTTKPQ